MENKAWTPLLFMILLLGLYGFLKTGWGGNLGIMIFASVLIFWKFTNKDTRFVIDDTKNYANWYKTDRGQTSGWPDPRQVGDSINAHRRISDVFSTGFYWRYIWRQPSGKLAYLDLECAPITWDPEKDFDYTNLLKISTPKIHPTSPTQEFNRDKNLGYNSKLTIKDARKLIKEQTGFDPMERRIRRRYVSS